MSKILSIVVPTYNMEKYLDRCLTSLIIEEEKLDSLEVLVINDGSKDRSSEIAHGYEARYPQTFRVIDKENGNYGSCVNRGLSEAKGKYIKILDADDRFDTSAFSTFIDVLSGTDVDCVLSDMKMVKDDGVVVDLCSFNLPHDMSEISISSVVRVADKMWMHCTCFKTEKIRSVSYHQTEGISYTDQEWIGLPIAVSDSFVYFPETVYLYLVGRSGQTIDMKVWERNFAHEIDGLVVMIRERCECAGLCSPDGLKYFDVRIVKRIKTVYYNYFWLFTEMNDSDRMAKLDRRVLEYDRDLYDELGRTVTLFNLFPVLSYWRKRNYKVSSFMLFMKKAFRLKNRKIGRYYP